MQILVVEPQKSPVIMETGGRLKEMQKIVGGTIQAIYPFPEEVALICNDERKILGLPLNRGLRDEHGNLYDIICGHSSRAALHSTVRAFPVCLPNR